MKFEFGQVENAIQFAVNNPSDVSIIELREEYNPESDYLCTYAYFVEKLFSPDYPCDDNSGRWIEALNISGKLISIWDYDYYQLALVLNNDNTITIRKYEQEWTNP